MMQKKTLSRPLMLLIIISFIITGSGIINTIETVAADEEVIIIGTTDKIRNIDPADSYEYFGSNTLVQLGHGLMELPRDAFAAVQGPIVDSYTVSADSMVYTFTLKDGIKFSDGETCDAAAVKWNIDRNIALNGDPGF
ncbi:MAG: ABC transporter substrate-binding protein, partial [Candidatus Hodarchaeota archaeon]